jgi:hypothetical protein
MVAPVMIKEHMEVLGSDGSTSAPWTTWKAGIS